MTGRIRRVWIVTLISLMPMSLGGCASLIAEGIARTVNDPGPIEIVPMVPLGSPSTAALSQVKQQTEADSASCAERARVSAGRRIGSHATRSKLAAEGYVRCMAMQGYRCVDRSDAEACKSAWTHPTASRAQLGMDSGECSRAVLTVILASTRHARYVECMASKGYRADVVEPTGETSASPLAPNDRGSTDSPPVAAEAAPDHAQSKLEAQPPTGSATTATRPRPSTEPGALKWPPVGASYVQSVRKSGSFGSGTEMQTIRYLGEQAWQGKTVRAFSDGSRTTFVDEKRRMLARVNSANGMLIESYEPYFVLADWPLRVGKWWANRYRYSDHEWNRYFNNAQYDGEVEAYENVKTPAGTFKSFRIVLGGPSGKTVTWYSGQLGIVVKTRTERFSNHFRGAGLTESELISFDFTP